MKLVYWPGPLDPSPLRPLVFGDAPGPALIRNNLVGAECIRAPSEAELHRLAAGVGSERVLALFDLPHLDQALPACRLLAESGVRLVAVRGRSVPQGAVAHFEELWLDSDAMELFGGVLDPLPRPLRPSAEVAFSTSQSGVAIAFRAVFTRTPNFGMLGVEDLGESWTGTDEIPALSRLDRDALLVDLGGEVEAISRELERQNRLACYLGPAGSPLPESVIRSGAAIHHWIDDRISNIDQLEKVPADNWSAAWVPVGFPDDDISTATGRLLAIRDLGYDCVIPRFVVPAPNTRGWREMEERAPRRAESRLDGRDLAFALPGFGPATGRELLEAWTRENVYAPSGSPAPRYSLGVVRDAIDGYISERRRHPSQSAAQELIRSTLATVGETSNSIRETDSYPFLEIGGRNAVEIVDSAIATRLTSLGGPIDLRHAVQHAPAAGGKRLRPVLALAITSARNVPLELSVPAALALEWIHTASLMQDDLPCMDDDAIRRGAPTAHIRHGEARTILASDALVALAFEDVARLGDDPRVGPQRALQIVRVLADSVGTAGLAGGQARELQLREVQVGDARELIEVHRGKTAPLFRAAASIGSILGGVDDSLRQRLEEQLTDLGLAFQIVDDLLDAEWGVSGRGEGSDRRSGTATFATLMERAAAQEMANQLVSPLRHLVSKHPAFGSLWSLASFAVNRRH